jgi:hypothetical protein
MANKDMFAPPTSDELKMKDKDLFAAPTQEELELEKPKSAPRKLYGSIADKAYPVGEALGELGKKLGETGLIASNSMVGGAGPLLGGAISAGEDLVHSGLHKILPNTVSPSNSQLEDQLALLKGQKPRAYSDQLSSMYKQGQDDTRADIQGLKDDVGGIPSTGAEMLGGVVPFALGGGLIKAGAGAITKAIPALEGVAQGGSKLADLYSQYGDKIRKTGWLGKGVMATADAAPIGAGIEAVGSKHGLIGTSDEDKQDYLGDIENGAATSGGIGLATSLGASAAKGLGSVVSNMAKDTPYGERVKNWYELGKDKGLSLFRSGDKKALQDIEGSQSDGLTQKIVDAREQLGNEIGQSTKNSTAKIPISDSLSNFADQLDQLSDRFPGAATKEREIAKMFKSTGIGADSVASGLSPEQAIQTTKTLNELAQKYAKDTTPQGYEMKQLLQKFAGAVDNDVLTAVPEYAQARARYASFHKNVINPLFNGSTPEEMSNFYFGKLKDKNSKLTDATREMVQGARAPGLSNEEGQKAFNKLQDTLPRMKDEENQLISSGKLDPSQSVFNNLGTPDSFKQDVISRSDTSNAIRKGLDSEYKSGTSIGGNLAKTVLGVSEKTTYLGANAAGLAGRKVSEWGQKLSSMTDDQLLPVVSRLRANDPSSPLAASLESALRNKDQLAKNAAIFSAMQNPNTRAKIVPTDD